MQTNSAEPAPHDDFFPQLADGAPVMIWMSGVDMGCFYFNQAWLEFRGRTLQEEFGNGWAEGVHPEDLQRCVNHYVGCFERRLAFAMSYRLLHHSGAYRWILDRGAPHCRPDGTFLGFFGGCAELENDAHVSLHAALGCRLSAMKEFARRLASEAVGAVGASNDGQLLRDHARHADERHQGRLEKIRHAAAEIEQLATDMHSFRALPPGACLP